MKTRIALVVLAVLAVPCAAAAGVPDDAPTAAAPVAAAAPSADVAPAAPTAASSAAAPAPAAPLEPLFLADSCYAEQYCIHQPPVMVSCSGPPGTTCGAFYGGCGYVTCAGVTTRCPGYCVGDHHCYNFCKNTYGSFDFFCNFGCCECL